MMRIFFFAMACCVVVGCNGSGGPVVKVSPETKANELNPAIANKVKAGDKSTVLVPKPIDSEKSLPVKVPTEPVKPAKEFKQTPLSAAVAGRYRLRLSDEQNKMFDEGLKDLRDRAQQGDKNAVTLLEQAEQVKVAAQNLTIDLVANGRYVANIGTGESTGKVSAQGSNLEFLPDNPAEAKSGLLKAVHNPDLKQLTVTIQGETMIFVKS